MPKFRIVVPTSGYAEYEVEADNMGDAFDAICAGEADFIGHDFNEDGDDWECEEV